MATAARVGYVAAVAWTFALALVDGWRRGVAERLTAATSTCTRCRGSPTSRPMLAGFADRILDFQPGFWTTHIAGHPPGALLVFVWLDRIGLGGGGRPRWSCVLVGARRGVRCR